MNHEVYQVFFGCAFNIIRFLCLSSIDYVCIKLGNISDQNLGAWSNVNCKLFICAYLTRRACPIWSLRQNCDRSLQSAFVPPTVFLAKASDF